MPYILWGTTGNSTDLPKEKKPKESIFKRLPLGTQVSVFGLLFLAVALTAGLAFVYEAEQTRLNELIHDKASRVLRAFEASHTQAMIHRGDTSDGNAVVDALNGTMEQLSHSQENMKIWVFMGPKVLEFQTDTGRTEIEPPVDAVDREAVVSRKPVGRFIGGNTYRLSVPVIMGQGPGADPRCATCHQAIMGIKAGETIGGYAVAYDATGEEANFRSFFYRTSLYVGGLIFLTTLLLLVIVNRLAARPIREIAHVLRRMADGEEALKIPAPASASNSDIAEILSAAAVFDGYARSQMEQLRRALDAHAIVSIADVKGNITFANDLFCQLSGYSLEELIGQNHRIVKSDFHPPEFYRELWRTIANGETWHGEIKNKKKSGEYYWVSATISPSLGPDGKPYQYVAIRTDITREKELNEMLEESQNRFMEFTETASDWLWEMDENLRFSYFSEQFTIAYGADPKQFLGKTRQEIGAIASDAFWENHLRSLERHEPFREFEYSREVDGKTSWYTISGKPVFDDDGNFRGYRGTGRNITRRKEQERLLLEIQEELQVTVTSLQDANERIEAEVGKQIALAEDLAQARDAAETANKVKSEFVASMSHEIRTPMTGVMGFADLLLEDDLDEKSREKVFRIKDSTRALMRIINDILDVSKLEAGKFDLEYIDFHFPSLVEEVVAMFAEKRYGTRANSVSIEINLSDDFPVGVNLDPARIRQLLINLVGNARKFTERGKIEVIGRLVTDEMEAPKLYIAVKDTGIGIKPEVVGNLFSDFTQADASISRRFHGTGLGLSICKKLVTLMGGEIGVDSVYGEGSTFWFTLPFKPAQTDVDHAGRHHLASSNFKAAKPIHILVVDDNALNRQIISGILKMMGHTFDLAENGMQAIEMHELKDFDLILMDIRMPVMSGPDATHMIRQMEGDKSKVPIVALTADAMEEHVKSYLAAGMDGVATKPIEIGLLALTMNEVLGEEINVPEESPAPPAAAETEVDAAAEEENMAAVDDFLKQIGAS